jgi:putative flavoprotein involved in K+ transport
LLPGGLLLIEGDGGLGHMPGPLAFVREERQEMAGETVSSAPVIVVGAGQSGLAAARALLEVEIPTVILEASDRPSGSWPSYYDSLRSFSPVAYSSLPGLQFPGEPDHYPTRDEVAGYLERYAALLDVDIRTDTRVVSVRRRQRLPRRH